MATSFVPTFKFFSIASLDYLGSTRRYSFSNAREHPLRTPNPVPIDRMSGFLRCRAQTILDPGGGAFSDSIPPLNIDRILAA